MEGAMMQMQEPTPVPTASRSNEVLRDVMDQHQLSQAWLADETGFAASYISRVLDGQYAAPPEVMQALWQRTKDQRVARLALGEHEHLILSLPREAPAWSDAAIGAINSAASAIVLINQHQAETPANPRGYAGGPRSDLERVVENAIHRLCAVRRALETPAPVPTP